MENCNKIYPLKDVDLEGCVVYILQSSLQPSFWLVVVGPFEHLISSLDRMVLVMNRAGQVDDDDKFAKKLKRFSNLN